MSEIVIPAPIECVWVGDDLFGSADDHRQGVGRVGYWMDEWNDADGVSLMSPHLDRSVRRPIWVLCPAWYREGQLVGTPFCVDRLSSMKGEPWDVTVDMESLVVGQKPKLTVHPSIHLVGIWHGWLQDGVLHQ